MKKYAVLFVCSVVAIYAQQGLIRDVQPGFTGPILTQGQVVAVSKPIKVAEAKKLPHDSWVILTGNIVGQLPEGKHNYMFRDSSGEINVDIGPKEWRGLSVGVSDKVEIYGEVKTHREQISIKAHAITGTGKTNALPGQAVTVNRPITIGEAVKLPHDSWIILTGNIVGQLPEGKHNYMFRDSSGEVNVDIGPKEWRGLSVGVSDKVKIYGEVKTHRGQISIKVHTIQKNNGA
jgi:uncharacterized protein (TIGR00156 family)